MGDTENTYAFELTSFNSSYTNFFPGGNGHESHGLLSSQQLGQLLQPPSGQ